MQDDPDRSKSDPNQARGGVGEAEAGFGALVPASHVHVSAARLLADPRLTGFVAAMCNDLLAIYKANPRMGRLLGSHRRWFMVHIGFALATARSIDPTDEGLTAARMAALMERYGLASRNTVTSFIAELRAYRFIADIPGHAGRRSRPLIPTTLAVTGMARWMGANLACLDQLDGGSRVQLLQEKPELLAPTQARAARILAEVDEWLRPKEAIQLFFNMEAGGLILDFLFTRLDLSMIDQPVISMGKLNVSAMARQFLMSRIHLDRVLRRVEETGSLVRIGNGQHGLSQDMVTDQIRRQALKLAVIDLALADAIDHPDRKIDFFA